MNPSVSIPSNGSSVLPDGTFTSQLDSSQLEQVDRQASGAPSASDSINVNAIFSAVQVFSGASDYDELLHEVAHLMLQNVGGDRCVLLLPDASEEWQIKAIAPTPHQPSGQLSDQCLDQPLELCATAPENTPNSPIHKLPVHQLPVQLIQHVERTQTPVIINDFKADLPVINAYLTELPTENPPKSILCQPLIHQNNVVGIVYLTHQSTSGAFSGSQPVALDFLFSQAAFALENAHFRSWQKEQAGQLALAEANLCSLYENADDPILLLSETEFVDCNQAAIALFEADTKDQLCALHPSDISPAFQADGQSSFDKAQVMIQQGLQKGNCRFEWQHKTLTGRIFWAEVVLKPLRYQDQMVLHSIVRDISQRKEAEVKILQKSQALEQALTQLKCSQAQVIQAEKMSALGNLVAGVAHEINNPIGFLNGSINNAKTYIQDLQSQLQLYQEHYPEPVKAIEENAEDIDLDFVCEDLPNLLTAMQRATTRIKSISTSLRTFSRADTEDKVSANLHEGLDSTLLILKYRLKADENRPEITVTKDYGELPAIDCFPGQLNQVFMNLLANAIDVFDEAAQHSTFAERKDIPQNIFIKTAVFPDASAVEIRIGDDGKGMPAAVKERIFDHLFTTKAVGKGTGLGLGISRQIIVEAHGGTIDVQSELGQGTEFCIRLPY
ncbi:MAG: ATP-binding protein [Phormidesmis sp.]